MAALAAAQMCRWIQMRLGVAAKQAQGNAPLPRLLLSASIGVHRYSCHVKSHLAACGAARMSSASQTAWHLESTILTLHMGLYRWNRARSELDRIRGGAGSELNRWRGARKQDALAADLPSSPQLSSKRASSPSAQQRSASSEATSSSGSQNGNTVDGSPDKSAVWNPSLMSSAGDASPATGAAAAPQQQQASQRPGRASSNGGGGANGSSTSALVSSTEQPYPQPAGGSVQHFTSMCQLAASMPVVATLCTPAVSSWQAMLLCKCAASR